MIGPTITFSIVGSGAGRVTDEQVLEEPVAELGDEAGEQEPERDLLPQHLPVAAEVVRDVRPRAHRGEPLAPGQPLAGRVMLMARVGLDRVRTRLILELPTDEQPQQHRHQTIITIPPRYSAA